MYILVTDLGKTKNWQERAGVSGTVTKALGGT